MDRNSLELFLRQGLSLEEIGRRVRRHPSSVGYWVQKYGLQAINRDKHAARGGLRQEQLAPLVESGATLAEMAAEFEVSKATVRHWLLRYGMRTLNQRGRRAAAEKAMARQEGRATIRASCRHHGDVEFFLEGRGYYRCKRCRAEAVVRRRRRVKSILVEEAGGRCCVCGYDRYFGALEFNHVDPLQKRLELNAKGVAVSLDKLRAEARKCILLCSNCHAEVEARIVSPPEAAVFRQ